MNKTEELRKEINKLIDGKNTKNVLCDPYIVERSLEIERQLTLNLSEQQ